MKKTVRILLIVGTILAAIKMLIGNYSLDEEYQIVMSYRPLIGDCLFTDMWEPHQSSAFICTLFIQLYTLVAGTTTGVVIFLRVIGTVIHAAIAYYTYRVMKDFLTTDCAVFIGLIYFNLIPKQIMIPEFGSMQAWFFTLICLFLIRYVNTRGSIVYVILAGIAMSLEVLSYPSCIILFPFFIVAIVILKQTSRIRDACVFALTCALCGGTYLCIILRFVSIGDFILNIGYIISKDSTHVFSWGEKLLGMGKDLGILAIWIIAIFTISFGVSRLVKSERRLHFLCLSVVLSCVVQLLYWTVLNVGYEYPQIHLVVIAICGILLTRDLEKPVSIIVRIGLWGTLLSYLAVIYFTDLSLTQSIPHCMPVLIFTFMAFCSIYTKEGLIPDIVKRKENPYVIKPFQTPSQVSEERLKHQRLVTVMLLFFLVTVMFGKGFTNRSGYEYNNILETRGVMKYGPAIGTFSSYMGAYIYNKNYENWMQNIKEGDRVLLVTDCIMSVSTTEYLFKDVDICHFSIVDPTSYDERLKLYWSLYPDKEPNVIVVDCWFGKPLFEEDSYIMQYIENEFGYSEVVDGDYIRFYRK